jgi:hypothetical protein
MLCIVRLVFAWSFCCATLPSYVISSTISLVVTNRAVGIYFIPVVGSPEALKICLDPDFKILKSR